MHATDLLVALRLDAIGVTIAHYHVACKLLPAAVSACQCCRYQRVSAEVGQTTWVS